MTSPRLAALDLSLTSTGIARWDLDESPEPITYAVHSHLSGVRRLRDLRDQILGIIGPVHLAVIEGYNFGAAGRANSAHQLGELGGVIRLSLYDAAIPFVEVPPAKLKAYATGKGNASKLAVYQQAIRRASREFPTTDEADAWWLLQMALAHYGLPHIPMPAVNRAVLAKSAWPELKLEVPT